MFRVYGLKLKTQKFCWDAYNLNVQFKEYNVPRVNQGLQVQT
jgi:hypothetical protein